MDLKESLKLSQEEIWDIASVDWKEYRQKPLKEVEDFLKDKTGKILDLGCGSGRNFCAFNKKVIIYAADFSEKMLNYAKNNSDKLKINTLFFKTSASKLDFKDNYFDCAIYIATLHCIEKKDERENSLKELYRVLNQKSRAIITVWSRNQERVKNKPKDSFIPWTIEGKKYFRYYYIYDKEEIEELIKKIGFKIISLKENENIIIEVEK